MLSIVPRSHSRATISAVSSVPLMVITSAITPGTIASAERSSELNQNLCCRSTLAACNRRSPASPPIQDATAPLT